MKRKRILQFHARPQIEPLESKTLLAASPIITEFSASNNDVLMDGFGNSSDWIEIFNAGDESVDLNGYHLTDDADNMTKWSFPSATNLQAGEYLIVFASGQNVADPDQNQHTNFRLNSGGEYIGLAAPDGTLISEFGSIESDYPKQFSDITYGLGQTSRTDILVGSESPAQILIPDSNALGTTWTEKDFQPDANWTDGQNGIGFDIVAAAGDPSILKLDFNDDDSGESGDENTEAGWQTFHLNQNGAVYDGIRVTLSAIGEGISLEGRDRAKPTDNPPSLTLDQIFDDFVFARSSTDGKGMEILIEGLSAAREYELTLWSFDSGSIGSRVSNWIDVTRVEPVAIESNYTFNGNNEPSSDLDNAISASLIASDEGTLRIHGIRNGGTSFGVFLNALEIVAPNAVDLIQQNIQADMWSQQSSAYARFPFSVDAGVSYQQLSLDMQYDAGFVAYLNGQEVARRNVLGIPGTPPAFDRGADSERTLDATVQPETMDLSGFANLIQGGQNVLAIHGLNTDASDDDFLMRAGLTATELKVDAAVYFTTPTPGATNSGVTSKGFVEDTSFSVDRGFYSEPFSLEITTSTPGASIIYTTDGSEPALDHGSIVESISTDVAPLATVPITTTSYVRAFAFKDQFLSTNIDTQSYLYLDDVIQQDPKANPGGLEYPDRWQANAVGDYEMDPEVVAEWDDNNPDNTDFGIREALTSIPTMSIVMNHDDLWSSSDGIYRNSNTRGSRWRKPASVEYFDPNTGEEFHVNAGVQIHGGASRDNVRLKKHSFRLLFREDFGPSELNYPLYDDTDNQAFNTLVLRAFFTDAFATRTITDRYNPVESQYLRDVWMKDTQLAMGNLSAHNTYVHLYINGLYWGLYNPSERPDEAFLAQYLGGEREDWDVVKDFNELFAGSKTDWNDMFRLARDLASSDNPNAIYQQLQGNNPDGTPNPELPNYLDMDNLIDFMILHLYAGVEDWPHHNWYAGRNRVDPGKGYKFFVWDQEIGVDHRYRDRTNVTDANTPADLYNRLYKSSDAFRLRFADRVQKHLFNDGALTVEANQARWMARANEIEKAIIGESARWGDAREGERHRLDSGGPTVTIPVMTVDLWREERDRVIGTIMQREHELLLERLGEIDLVAPLNAPQFSQHGGTVPTGFELTVNAEQDPLLIETAIVPEFSPVTVHVPRNGNLDAADGSTPVWAAVDFDDSQWLSGDGGVGFENRSGYEPLLGVDLFSDSIPSELGMDANNDGAPDIGSFYARFAFELPADFDAASFERVILKMKYDDGFAAFLNGQLIHEQNAPDDLAWDERATAAHEAEVSSFDEFDVTEHLNQFVAGGTNVLAIQAFNRTKTSNDFVISPELVVGAFREVGQAPVYFTIDGSDPRLQDGEVNAGGAVLYEGPIELTQTSTLKARARIEGIWSALTEATFIVNPADANDLAITEINFNPHGPTDGELELIPSLNNDDFEFLEIQNTSPTETISLLGMHLTNGVEFVFPDVSLDAGQYALVVANVAGFEARYGTELPVLGQWTGRLSNTGERVEFTDANDQIIISFTYNDSDPWPSRADAVGGTLQLVDPANTVTDEYSKHYRWEGSSEFGGSPGAAGVPAPGIVINEVVSRTDLPLALSDSIELHNQSDAAIDISGWYLSDSRDALLKFEIPADTVVESGGYVVFDESHFNPNPAVPDGNDFALDGTGGDDVWLVIADQGPIEQFVDDVHFGAAATAESFGRVPNGVGRLAPMSNLTLGAQNSEPRVGPVIISELNYNPAPPTVEALALYGTLDNNDLEFVEIHNPSPDSVNLNGWRLRGGIDFEFDDEMLQSNATIVVVSFNPENEDNSARLAAFRTNYGMDDGVKIVGGYANQLSNAGERLALQRAGIPAADEPDTVPHLLEDEVIYDDRLPWPLEADGVGSSLQRKNATLYGNDSASWSASSPGPGVVSFGSPSADFNNDGQINMDDLDLLCTAIPSGISRYDVNQDNAVNQLDVTFMVQDILQTVTGDTNLDGRFDSGDLVRVFQAGEYEDDVIENSTWTEGDWNCDREFTTRDLVLAFQAGTYSNAARSADPAGIAAAIDRVIHVPAEAESYDPLDGKLDTDNSHVQLKRELHAIDRLFDSLDDWDEPQTEFEIAAKPDDADSHALEMN